MKQLRKGKVRRPANRIAIGVRIMRHGVPIEEAARRAGVSTQQLRKALQVDRRLTETEGAAPMTTNPGIGAVGGTGPSTLGTTGAPYGSEAMEQMVADRIRELKASGRPAQRMAVIRELASQGAIQTMQPRPTNLTEDQHEQALTQSLPAEQRAKQVASQARQGHTPQPDGAGPTLTGGVAQQAQHTRPRASARPVMPTEGPAPTAAQLSSATSARVGGLVDQVVRLAEARGWPLEHALGAVWAYHGAERNRYPEGAWAGVLQDLGIELPPQG